MTCSFDVANEITQSITSNDGRTRDIVRAARSAGRSVRADFASNGCIIVRVDGVAKSVFTSAPFAWEEAINSGRFSKFVEAEAATQRAVDGRRAQEAADEIAFASQSGCSGKFAGAVVAAVRAGGVVEVQMAEKGSVMKVTVKMGEGAGTQSAWVGTFGDGGTKNFIEIAKVCSEVACMGEESQRD